MPVVAIVIKEFYQIIFLQNRSKLYINFAGHDKCNFSLWFSSMRGRTPQVGESGGSD
jgi:hypothetical protein